MIEVVNVDTRKVHIADVDTNESTIVIHKLRGDTNFYLNVSSKDDIKIRTNKGYQVELKPSEFYIMNKLERVTHIKMKGDRAFRLV